MGSSLPQKKIPSIEKEIVAIHDWMQNHEADNNKRFAQSEDMMKGLATKDDLSTVMLDQASKADVRRLTRMLINDDGTPKFATAEDMQPVLSLYKGSVFTKSLLLGTAAIIGAIVGIGWGLIQLSSWLRH